MLTSELLAFAQSADDFSLCVGIDDACAYPADGTLQGEWPKPITSKPKKKKSIAEKLNKDFVVDDSDFGDTTDDEGRTLFRKRGPLFNDSMNFLRVVLDEAHK